LGRVSSVPEPDLEAIRAFCDSRVPAHLRDEARIEADVRGKSVTIFDCRAPWHPELTDWSRLPVAQLRYEPASQLWTLHWADRNGRWHRYLDLESGPADKLLHEIDADPTGIFWG
jgi:hypothetical protein